MVSGTECVGMDVMLKCFAGDKGNKNNWSYPRRLEALNPRGPYSNMHLSCALFHMSGNCESTTQVAALVTHFPKTCVIETWIIRPSTCFINHKLCRFLSSIVLSTCSPISGRNLVWKCSRFGGHPWCEEGFSCEWLWNWCLYMRSFVPF